MTVMAVAHTPVLLEATLSALAPLPGDAFIDATVGGGGHAYAIGERLRPGGRLLGIDADPEALAEAAARLHPFGDTVALASGNFADLGAIAARHGFASVQGILFDLGVSSLQLGSGERGFSFREEGPLDMRLSPEQSLTAADIVNTLPPTELASLLYRLGEEPRSRRIARAIIAHRPIATTTELARVVADAIPRQGARLHPATKTFLALRLAVNDELANLEAALEQAVDLLAPGGRLAVISFHSLEDRIVKRFFRREAGVDADAPEAAPVDEPRLRLLLRKPIVPTAAEVAANPRSRSAKLRAAVRLEEAA